jgi:CRP-like cAMP-binding protein
MASPNLFLNLFRDKEGKNYAAGQFVFKAGDHGQSMFIITQGEVEVREGSTILDTIGPGSIVGEMALIDDAPRSASVVAKSDCRLVAVDRRQFEFMVQETPFFALAVMKVLADRLRRTSARASPSPS